MGNQRKNAIMGGGGGEFLQWWSESTAQIIEQIL